MSTIYDNFKEWERRYRDEYPEVFEKNAAETELQLKEIEMQAVVADNLNALIKDNY